jgi:N-acetylneuraminate synthase
MVERYQFTPGQHREMFDYCRDRRIAFLSSCFSVEEVDLLESLGVAAHKIASMDINHVDLLRYVARTGKPVLLATGMASLAEVAAAVDVLRAEKAGPLVLLHCVSIYPPDLEIVNLRNIPMLGQAFDAPVGLSDHTLGLSIPLAATALGACVIEKHFTLDKQMQGWDHGISADPDELSGLVRETRNVFTALGSPVRTVSEAEIDKRKKFRRSLVITRALKKGTVLSARDLNAKRPGTGIRPDQKTYVVGRVLGKDVEEDHELNWSDLV